MAKDTTQMEKLMSLCKRRGFIFQSSEIYGGINGFWDYGPLGVELKRNIKDAWWYDMVTCREDVVGLDCSIIMNPKVWEASGHVGGFSDPMVDCKACRGRFREDQVSVVTIVEKDSGNTVYQRGTLLDGATEAFEALPKKLKKEFPDGDRYNYELVALSQYPGSREKLCPNPNCPDGELTEGRDFNLMFETHTGAIRDESSKTYLRPETAQGIFVNFKNVCDSTRIKIPFGIAQIGKSFRNEINPRNYTFRSREFEQMEIEFFCHPDESDKWYEYWRDLRHKWYLDLGLKSDKLILRNHEGDELAHYAKACSDVEYLFPFADQPQELEGVANRTDFDLKAHAAASGKDLSYFDPDRKERFIPYVIEPSAGADRATLAVLCEAYTVDPSRPSEELMKFHPRIAPIKAAVFPLVAKDGMPEIAHAIYDDIKRRYPSQIDIKQSIGKRYARMDEAGTPYCFTIDGQTKADGTVTVRDRDTGQQERIDKSRVLDYLRENLDPTLTR